MLSVLENDLVHAKLCGKVLNVYRHLVFVFVHLSLLCLCLSIMQGIVVNPMQYHLSFKIIAKSTNIVCLEQRVVCICFSVTVCKVRSPKVMQQLSDTYAGFLISRQMVHRLAGSICISSKWLTQYTLHKFLCLEKVKQMTMFCGLWEETKISTNWWWLMTAVTILFLATKKQ